MGMRITNGIINNNTKSNILVNKEYSDKYNTMVATGQKITRPSDDPIVAIRALRLNNNISEINQYYGKNIPDAEAWLEVTETALKQTEGVLSSVQEALTQGASDDNTADDRKNILENLKGLRDQIYSSGNADYAGRTVFTGFRTGESLTYTKDETKLMTMVEKFTDKDFETFKYVSGAYDKDILDFDAYNSQTDSQLNVKNNEVIRLRLAYDNLTTDQNDIYGNELPREFAVKDKDGNTLVEAGSFSVKELGTNQAANDRLYTEVDDYGVTLITTTGELIIGKKLAEQMRQALYQNQDSTLSVEYAKEDWKKNDLRPEHYFAAKTYDSINDREIDYNYDDDGNPAFEDKKIQYEIAYNQKLDININADEVYKTSIARDVDALLNATQDCQTAYEKLKKVEDLEKNIDGKLAPGTSEYEKQQILKDVKELKDSLQKQYDYYKENMQKTFSRGLTIFKGYSEDINNKIAALGGMSNRVKLTKNRVGDQLDNFKELADENINVELTESAIDLKNAEIALEAAQQAAAKVAKASLLNYL